MQLERRADCCSGLERRKRDDFKAADAIAKCPWHYREGLGFEVLHEFRDYDGFDGVMLGRPGAPYHLEFTSKVGHTAGRAPIADNLLVFYLPDHADWLAAVNRLEKQGHSPVPDFNPYWNRDGKTFEDPDGYRVVLQHAAWSR